MSTNILELRNTIINGDQQLQARFHQSINGFDSFLNTITESEPNRALIPDSIYSNIEVVIAHFNL